MKTKHLLPVLVFVTALFANTQTVQAQTKEETIAWIREKFEKYSGSRGIQFKKVSVLIEPCEIV